MHVYGIQPFIFLKVLNCDKFYGFRMYVCEVIPLLHYAEYHDQNSFEIEFHKMSVPVAKSMICYSLSSRNENKEE
jgi:hypothetical protein